MNKEFYTVKEFASIMGVHWQTVRNWIKSGKVRAVKMGGKNYTLRIPKEEVYRLKVESLDKF